MTEPYADNLSPRADGLGYIGGWLREDEDEDFLAGLENDDAIMALTSSDYEEIRLDARQVLQVENQGGKGACQGHALSSIMEWCYMLQTGDLELQLSREMGYVATQWIDNIRGDRGSTISGGIKLARTTGLCVESMWPYSERYSSAKPSNYDEIKENAARYRCFREHRMSSYDAIRKFLGAGIGGISIGIGWNNSVDRPLVESYSSGGGGHAIALPCLSKRVDRSGQPYVWMKNSWSKRWGNQGWAEWSPRAIASMLTARWTVAIGLSDMQNVQPRRFSKDDWKDVFTI